MQLSVGILGTGWVGTSVATSVLHGGFVNALLLADARAEVAEGEAMDLAQGAEFYPTASVRAVPPEGLLETDALVLAAGRGGKAGESRLDLLRDNARTLRALAAGLRDYRGLVIVVTNPVDVLTFVVAESSGLPPERVMGTGTMLATARLRQAIGEELRINAQSVHAHAHPPVYAADQWQGETLHPHPPDGVGIRAGLPQQSRAHARAGALSRLLQHRPSPHGHPRSDAPAKLATL